MKKTLFILYVIGAVVSFGPIYNSRVEDNASLKQVTMPRAASAMEAMVATPLWPLYWSIVLSEKKQ